MYNKFISPIESQTLTKIELDSLTIEDFSLRYETGYRINISKHKYSSYVASFNRYGEPYLRELSYDERHGGNKGGLFLPFNVRNGEYSFQNIAPKNIHNHNFMTLDVIKKDFIGTIKVNGVTRRYYIKYKEFLKKIIYTMNNIILSFEIDIHNKINIIKNIKKEFFNKNMRRIDSLNEMLIVEPIFTDIDQMLPNDTQTDLENSMKIIKNKVTKNRTTSLKFTPIKDAMVYTNELTSNLGFIPFLIKLNDIAFSDSSFVRTQNDIFAWFEIKKGGRKYDNLPLFSNGYQTIVVDFVRNDLLFYINFQFYGSLIFVKGWIIPHSILAHIEILWNVRWYDDGNHNDVLKNNLYRKYHISGKHNTIEFVHAKGRKKYEFNMKQITLKNISNTDKKTIASMIGMIELFATTPRNIIELEEQLIDIPRFEFQGKLKDAITSANEMKIKDSERGKTLNKFSGLWRKQDTYDEGIHLIRKAEIGKISNLKNEYMFLDNFDDILKNQYQNSDISLVQNLTLEQKSADIDVEYHNMLHAIIQVNSMRNRKRESISVISDSVFSGKCYKNHEIKEIGRILTHSGDGGDIVNIVSSDNSYKIIQKLKYNTNKDNISINFKKNFIENIASTDVKGNTLNISIDMVVYTPYKDTAQKENICFLLDSGEKSIHRLQIEESTFSKIKNIFENNRRLNEPSHLKLTNIIAIDKRFEIIDNLSDKNIYITTNISTPSSIHINNKSYTALGRFSISELASSKHLINDIHLEKDDIYQKKSYPLEIQSIEQLKNFSVYFEHVQGNNTLRLFLLHPPQLKFEFQFS